jgi:hypothetical protein
MCVFSIYLNFLEQRELRVEFFSNEILNFLCCAWFLVIELIAGHSNDLEPLSLPFFVCLGHFFIVGRGESSFAGYIDNHSQFVFPEAIEPKLFSFDIFHLDAKDILSFERLIKILFACFPDEAIEEPADAGH